MHEIIVLRSHTPNFHLIYLSASIYCAHDENTSCPGKNEDKWGKGERD